METILREVEKALDAGFAYLGIAVALTLPDLCAALASPNGDTAPNKYKNWYTDNLASKYPKMTADDFYSLRNGVVHQGKFGHTKMQYSRIIFLLPNPMGLVVHGAVMNDALTLDPGTFCRDIVASARQWFAANRNDPNVARNLPNLVQIRPNGLHPYFKEAPLIA